MPRDPLHSIARRGGLAATHELAHDGFTRTTLRTLLATGRIIRVRQGWYAAAGLAPEILRAARVGGRLTCSSALAHAGFWVQSDTGTHVAVDRNDCQLRSSSDSHRRLSPHDDVVVHWSAPPSARSRLLAEPLPALEALCGCASPEAVTAAADSMLHRHPEWRAAVRDMAENATSTARRALLDADGVCESGIETFFWLRMRRLEPRRQVPIAGIGRVDFLLGSRLVVEVDGARHHTGPEQFEADRRRDALLSTRGYRVLRFSYWQVVERWTEVEAAVWAAILRGDRT